MSHVKIHVPRRIKRRVQNLYAFMNKAGDRPIRYGDSGKGLEVNSATTHFLVSNKIYEKFDVARTTSFMKDEVGSHIHGAAWKANLLNAMVNYRDHKVKGRRG